MPFGKTPAIEVALRRNAAKHSEAMTSTKPEAASATRRCKALDDG